MYGTCGRIDNKADFDFDFNNSIIFSSDLMVIFSPLYTLVFCSSVFSAVSSVLRLGNILLLSVSSVRSHRFRPHRTVIISEPSLD